MHPVAWVRRLCTARILIMIALASGVLGGKFLVIDRYGSDLPFWDQWDGEGDFLIHRFAENRLTFHQLFAGHNEHRIFFTRILVLGLYLANDRQWDAKLE